MDFLDKIAVLLSPRHSSSHVEKLEEVDIVAFDSEVDTAVEKPYNKKRTSFAEKNFASPEKIYNDKFVKENPYRPHLNWGKDLIDRVLPFLNEKQDWAEWTYRNRYGVFITLGLYLGVLFGFTMISFEVTSSSVPDGILIDIEKVEKLEEVLRQMQEDATLSEDVSNQVSDENSKTKEDYVDKEWEKIDLKATVKLLDEALEQHMDMRHNMRSYVANMEKIDMETEQELKDARRLRDSLKRVAKEEESIYSKKKGNVTVSYDLEGRRALHLEIPAYLCEGGGKVVVKIEVNRQGRVVSATVKNSFGVSDPCVEEMAVWAANNSYFDVNNSAEGRQTGTMTYIFIAQ